MFSTINLLTFAAFCALLGLATFVINRIRSWQTSVGNELAADVSKGIFMGTSTPTTIDNLPSIVVPPDDLTRYLRQAGYYSPKAAEELGMLRVGGMLLSAVVTAIFVVMVGSERGDLLPNIIGCGIAGMLAAYLLPWIWMRLSASGRVLRIQRSLPDAFDMMSMCLTGGMGIHEALGHVSREVFTSHPDLGTELEIVRRQAEMTTLAESFRQFSARIDAPEVVSLAAMITQAERLGSNMVGAFRDFTEGIRLNQRQTADERANKASFKMLFPVMLLLLSAMIVLWGPAWLELRNYFRNNSGTVNTNPDVRTQR